jgi:hypothetical protein
LIADVLRVKLSELVGRFGIGLSGDARRSKALLADVCGDGFRGECAVLVAAVEEGVAGELLSSSSGLPTEVLLGRLSDRLQANRGVSSDLARWGVESWAVALGVVAGGNTLATFKMDGLAPLIDLAGADGTITDAELNHLVLEAKTRGVSEADARAYLSNYAAAHGWHLGNAQRRSGRAKAAAQPPPPQPPHQPAPPQPAPAASGAFRWVMAGVIGLAAIAVILVATRPNQLSQPPPAPPVPSPAPAPVPDAGQRQADLTEREQRTYNAARGNLAALRAYVNSCTVCAFQATARSEISKLQTADQEERTYSTSRGNKYALQAYINTCTVCAYESAARSEISTLEQQDRRTAPIPPPIPASCGGNADTPITLLYRAINQKDVDLYSQQLSEDYKYYNNNSKITQTKSQKIESKRKSFNNVDTFRLTMDKGAPELINGNYKEKSFYVLFSMKYTQHGTSMIQRGILEKYTVTCGSGGLWLIKENIDEITASEKPHPG